MAKKAFDKIAKSLNEALAIARGEARPAKLYTSTSTVARGKGKSRSRPMKRRKKG